MVNEIESATPREYLMPKNGKAPPVLMKMNNEMEAKALEELKKA